MIPGVPLLKLTLRLIAVALALSWRLVVVATPFLGVWLASSLVAFFGGPREAALVGGVLLFPVLPLVWEARGARRFSRRMTNAEARGADPPRRLLKTIDRVVLRTLVVNGAFVGALLVLFPGPAFTALATRGDWFLDRWSDESDHVVSQLRTGLHAAARGLEWLHELANPNPYRKEGDDAPVPDDVTPTDERAARAPTPANEGSWTVGGTHWPHEETLHPAVVAMPPEAETSIAAVATWLTAQEPDPFRRTKALHDWVVSRLHYDHDSVTGPRKPQDASSVFRQRMAVCEGYARLLVELGKYAGLPIVYVVGEVREVDGRAAPVGHAWNAVQVQGAWYFLDATWDDPSSAGEGAARDNYRTDYLFTPPSIAIFDHLPDDPRWQLLDSPLDRGAFLRQPMARPGLAKHGLTLKEPARPLVDAHREVTLVLDNPRLLHVLIDLAPATDARGLRQAATDCVVQGGAVVRARCALPGPGRFHARVFANAEEHGEYDGVAQVSVHSR